MLFIDLFRAATELRLAEHQAEAGHPPDKAQEVRARFQTLVESHPRGELLGEVALAVYDNRRRLRLLGIFAMLWVIGRFLIQT